MQEVAGPGVLRPAAVERWSVGDVAGGDGDGWGVIRQSVLLVALRVGLGDSPWRLTD